METSVFNIHPILVHFPIAFFTIYAVMECARFQFLTKQPFWFHVKAVTLIIGTLASFVTLGTGELIEEAFEHGENESLVEMHHLWANISVGIFTILAASYAIAWIKNSSLGEKIASYNQKWLNVIWRIAIKIQSFVLKPTISIILAVAGLVAITVTGDLGGSIAFGPDVDPFTQFIYGLFF